MEGYGIGNHQRTAGHSVEEPGVHGRLWQPRISLDAVDRIVAEFALPLLPASFL